MSRQATRPRLYPSLRGGAANEEPSGERHVSVLPKKHITFIVGARAPAAQLTAQLTLKNHAATAAVFKIKTNAAQRYCVRPSYGVVLAGATGYVEVELVTGPAGQANFSAVAADDRFLVMCCACAEWEAEAAQQLGSRADLSDLWARAAARPDAAVRQHVRTVRVEHLASASASHGGGAGAAGAALERSLSRGLSAASTSAAGGAGYSGSDGGASNSSLSFGSTKEYGLARYLEDQLQAPGGELEEDAVDSDDDDLFEAFRSPRGSQASAGDAAAASPLGGGKLGGGDWELAAELELAEREIHESKRTQQALQIIEKEEMKAFAASARAAAMKAELTACFPNAKNKKGLLKSKTFSSQQGSQDADAAVAAAAAKLKSLSFGEESQGPGAPGSAGGSAQWPHGWPGEGSGSKHGSSGGDAPRPAGTGASTEELRAWAAQARAAAVLKERQFPMQAHKSRLRQQSQSQGRTSLDRDRGQASDPGSAAAFTASDILPSLPRHLQNGPMYHFATFPPHPPSERTGINNGVGDDEMCGICLDARVNTIISPCGHRGYCSRCLERHMQHNEALCPTCRTSINGMTLLQSGGAYQTVDLTPKWPRQSRVSM